MTEYDTLDALKGAKMIRKEFLQNKIKYSEDKIEFHKDKLDRYNAELDELTKE